ncbi:MAG TPA: hypothetical protein VHG08_03440 [Longimicrobium sp.]|nr:hypothetical protein [Longimicrobium sp.]
MKRSRILRGAVAAAVLAACADTPSAPAAHGAAEPLANVGAPGTLQWFGYVSGADKDSYLNGTDSYANWGWVITNDTAASVWAKQRITALAQHNMKAIVELGRLLWCPPAYTSLCPDVAARWQAWTTANASVLTSDKVLAFVIRDEPFHGRVNIQQWQDAAAMVKSTFPWARISLVEAAVALTQDCEGYPSGYCHFDQYAHLITTVDWIGVNRYAIHPATDGLYQQALARMKQKYPGRRTVYVADGYWDGEHQNEFPGNTVEYMGTIMREWYEVARADPDAVLLGVFIWDPFADKLASRDFPLSVLYEQTRVGRAITGRTRANLYAPTGVFEGITHDGYAVGWACDPDRAWGETVRVDIYMNGTYYTSGGADQPDVFRTACRSGTSHRFRIPLGIGTSGQQMTARAVDLNAGVVQLPSTCPQNPACVWVWNP